MWAATPVSSLQRRHCSPSRETHAARIFWLRLDKPDRFARFGGTAVMDKVALVVSGGVGSGTGDDERASG